MTAKSDIRTAVEVDEDLARAREAVAAVPDPEIPIVTLADLGILRGVERRNGIIEVTLTPTYTGCPATLPIRIDVEAALLAAGVADAHVNIVLSPSWTTDDITDEGRRKLREFGIAPPPARNSRSDDLFGAPAVECPRCGSLETTRISEFGSTPCKALWRCETCREPFDVFKCL
ncbi:MAG: 1,2-phenylacetyl-CoA epoxidase subunit PaaD [Hyphomicrobiaceae bacterium]